MEESLATINAGLAQAGRHYADIEQQNGELLKALSAGATTRPLSGELSAAPLKLAVERAAQAYDPENRFCDVDAGIDGKDHDKDYGEAAHGVKKGVPERGGRPRAEPPGLKPAPSEPRVAAHGHADPE